LLNTANGALTLSATGGNALLQSTDNVVSISGATGLSIVSGAAGSILLSSAGSASINAATDLSVTSNTGSISINSVNGALSLTAGAGTFSLSSSGSATITGTTGVTIASSGTTSVTGGDLLVGASLRTSTGTGSPFSGTYDIDRSGSSSASVTWSAVEYGYGQVHTSVLTLSSPITLNFDGAGSMQYSFSIPFYTFTAGMIVIRGVALSTQGFVWTCGSPTDYCADNVNWMFSVGTDDFDTIHEAGPSPVHADISAGWTLSKLITVQDAYGTGIYPSSGSSASSSAVTAYLNFYGLVTDSGSSTTATVAAGTRIVIRWERLY